MASADPVTEERQSLYERDFYLWIEQQTALLRAGRLEEIDVANLLEELESLGRSEKRAIKSNLVVVLTHLLKYQLQPNQRSSRWRGVIAEHRRRLRDDFEFSPSLRRHAAEVFAEAYADACEQTAAETGLLRSQDEPVHPGADPRYGLLARLSTASRAPDILRAASAPGSGPL
jgi:hypothetical protein